jgi:hypothetical protein
MKKLVISFVSISILTLLSCNEQSTDAKDTNNDQNAEVNKPDSVVLIDSSILIQDIKYLITDTSVGHFIHNNPWQNIAKNIYNFQFLEGYGKCHDACCDGGYLLGNKIIDSEYGQTIEFPELTIGAVSFDKNNEDPSTHKNNPNVFFVLTDNCPGWYLKDKINYVVVYSEQFRTKEGVGVASTLEMAEALFSKLDFYIGWIEEDSDALNFTVKQYPNIEFILDIEDYKGNWEDISLQGEDNTLKILDFKKNTKIQRIIVNNSFE